MRDDMAPTLCAEAADAMKAVDGTRLLASLRDLATHGQRPDGGVAREALSEAELAARRWLVSSLQGPHYGWYIDDAANLMVRRAGQQSLPPVMTGSHIDTQPIGGWLDGAYGVMAGLEVLRALDDAGIRTLRPIDVVAWTNEEGCRFSPGTMGSSAFAASRRLNGFLEVRDATGQSFAEARDAARQCTPQADAMPLGYPVRAYIEAHIEQGPVLQDGGHTLGIVTGIQGVRWFEVIVKGMSAHAGTTPLGVRQDALLSAARLVAELSATAAAAEDPDLRWTVGRFQAMPGSVNTVAEQVAFTVDMRHPDDRVLDRLEARLTAAVNDRPGPCTGRLRTLMRRQPTHFDADVLRVVEHAARLTGTPHRRLVSGAFHDAMHLSDVCPAAMLFVPSVGGVSHHPAEDTPAADLVAGARALAGALTSLACS
jgi:beta-ureidopropionase / N-carbamoyl-L-amino-acid hydrolase